MPPKPGKPKMPSSERRKGTPRTMQDMVLEPGDKIEGNDRDLVHGEGGTLQIPAGPKDLSRDD